jgi:hypothetical protein
MPKKSASARNAAQRNKQKAQKSVQLVHQTVQEKDTLEEKEVATEAGSEDSNELADASASTVAALDSPSASADVKKVSAKNAFATAPRKNSAPRPQSTAANTEPEEISSSTVTTVPKGSAAARLAARRQAAQKNQPRMATTLITAQHYSYVRRELITIAILALIMFSVIIILHFVPGIGG